jgi:hypothetical protein
LSNYSENKLSTYSDGRTKTLSGEAMSSEKSDEIGDKTDEEEGNRLSSSTDRIEKENNTNSQCHNESVSSKDLYFEEDNREFIEDECDMCKETHKCQTESQTFARNTFYIKNDVSDKTNDKLIMERDIPGESYIRNIQYTEILLENQPKYQALRRRHNKTDTNLDRINVEISDTSYKKAGMEIESLGKQDSDSHVIKTCPDIHPVSHDADIISCESKQKTCTSKNTTRSNSAHSQDISDHAGNVRLKLKAYKVTERYKSNIMGRRTKCRKCCCVIS